MTVLIIDKLLYLHLKKVNQFLLRYVQSTIFFISLHSFISVINCNKMNNLVIVGHPDKNSFCYNGIFKEIQNNLEDHVEVKVVGLSIMVQSNHILYLTILFICISFNSQA